MCSFVVDKYLARHASFESIFLAEYVAFYSWDSKKIKRWRIKNRRNRKNIVWRKWILCKTKNNALQIKEKLSKRKKKEEEEAVTVSKVSSKEDQETTIACTT